MTGCTLQARMSHAAGVNWIEVGSLFAGAGAFVTAGLAVVTRSIAKKTNDVAAQTQELAEQTKKLAEQTEKLAEQTEKVAEETRSGAQAMHAQLDAIEVPFVVPVPNPNLRIKGHRESLDVVLPIHRVLRDGMRYVELRFINVGSGPAIVKGAQITTRSGDVKLLFEPIDHIPIAANESVDATLLTANTWAPNPSPLTFSMDYTAPDGRSYRTRGVAQLDGDGESVRCLTFERITEEEWESGI